jgi:5-methylcytosine-specific restriction endonuclease McrA
MLKAAVYIYARDSMCEVRITGSSYVCKPPTVGIASETGGCPVVFAGHEADKAKAGYAAPTIIRQSSASSVQGMLSAVSPTIIYRRTVTDLRGFWKEDSSRKDEAKKYVTVYEQLQQRHGRSKKKRQQVWKKGTSRKLRSQGRTPTGPPHPDYSNTHKFYNTREWKELRYLALKNCEGTCQLCGAKASDGVVICVDHIIPLWKAPKLALELDNLQVLCSLCNEGKGAWDSSDWREHWKTL